MKILVISQYFYPENFRINDIVKELVSRGNEVTVLTGLPNYPCGEIYEGYDFSYKIVSGYYGATVHRCKLRPRKKGLINLLRNYFSFVHQGTKKIKMLEPDFDLIFVYGLSPVSVGVPAINFKKKHKIPIVYYNLDVWPDCVVDLSGSGKLMSKYNPIYVVAKILSKYVYKNVDLILNKCDDFTNYLFSELKINKEKMVTLEEFAETSYLAIDEKPIQNNIIDFMFLGNIGKIQNCECIIDAFSNIEFNKNWLLHFVGDGSNLDYLKKYVEDKKMTEKVIFHGRVPVEKVNKFYEIADVCIVSLRSTTVAGSTPPGKLFSYMASARPILGIIDGFSKEIIQNCDCGVVCDQTNVLDIIEKINFIIDNFDKFSLKGVNGRNEFIKNYTVESFIEKLTNHFKNIIK